MRQALDAVASHGAKEGLAAIGISGGWPGVIAGFGVGVVVDEEGQRRIEIEPARDQRKAGPR